MQKRGIVAIADRSLEFGRFIFAFLESRSNKIHRIQAVVVICVLPVKP
jgi:hypothetical protein